MGAHAAALLRLLAAALLLLLPHDADADLYVLGLFPVDPAGKGGEFGDRLGRAERAEHFRLTAKLVNNKTDGWYDDILPDDTLHIKVADCEDERGCQAALLNALDDTGGTHPDSWPRIDAILGPYSSSATQSTLPISSYYNLPQISYSATSPTLSGLDPYFFRMPPPDSIKADAIVQLLNLFGRAGRWGNTTTRPNWRAAILQTDGAFGRGFATHFKERWQLANGGKTAIIGLETVLLDEISGISFDAMDPELKSDLQSLLRELTDIKGARVILIAAHSEDTWKILRLADEMMIADVLWLVIDPNSLPVDQLSSIQNGVFGFADRQPDYPAAVKYAQEWQSWGAGDAGACPCCSSTSTGCSGERADNLSNVYDVTGAHLYFLNGRYLQVPGATCSGEFVFQRVDSGGYIPDSLHESGGQPVLIRAEELGGVWLFAAANAATTCQSNTPWISSVTNECGSPLTTDCSYVQQPGGSALDRLLIEAPSSDCSCHGNSLIGGCGSSGPAPSPAVASCWLASLPQHDAVWSGPGEVFTSPAVATSRVAAPIHDRDGNFHTIESFSWFVHDALLAIATAFDHALTNPTEEHTDEDSALAGRWLPDVYCGHDMVIAEMQTKLAAQTACVANPECNFVEDRAPLYEGPYRLCRGFREMLEHCSLHSSGSDADIDSMCSRVFDYSSDPHRFAYSPHREAVEERCILIPPSDAGSLTPAELDALADACETSLVPGDRNSCGLSCYYQAPTPEQVVTGQHLRYELKTLNIRGVTGHVSFDRSHDREQYAYKLWNLQNGEFVHAWSLERSSLNEQGYIHAFDVECYDSGCAEQCSAVAYGECAELAFPDGSSRVPLDTIGTQAERDAEKKRLADLALLEAEVEEQGRQSAEQMRGLWKLISYLLAAIVVLGLVMGGVVVFNKHRRKTLVQRARAAVELAAEYQKAALRERMGDILFPDNWDKSATAEGGYQLKVELKPTDAEYWDVFDKLTATTDCGYGRMGGVSDDDDGGTWLSEVHRIQNPYLYTYYMFHKDRIAELEGRESSPQMSPQIHRSGDEDTEEEVYGWHGTGGFDAENIYADTQDGFMMQFAQAGFWGRGLYFAKDAGYSHEYATRGDTSDRQGFEDDEREMILVSLLTGRVATMGRDNTLIVPPFLNAAKSVGEEVVDTSQQQAAHDLPKFVGGSGERFNTVSGHTGGGKYHVGAACKENHPWSKVWVVYENGRAYPMYLVKYYTGARDPTRTPYATRREAIVGTKRIGGNSRLSMASLASTPNSVNRISVDNPMLDEDEDEAAGE